MALSLRDYLGKGALRLKYIDLGVCIMLQGASKYNYMSKEDTLQLYEYLRFLARTPKIRSLAPLLDPRDRWNQPPIQGESLVDPFWYPSESELEADPFHRDQA